jgi:hypothetical protein
MDTMPSPVVHDQDECIAGEEEEDLWIVNTARGVSSAASAWQQLSPSQRILQVCARATVQKAPSQRREAESCLRVCNIDHFVALCGTLWCNCLEALVRGIVGIVWCGDESTSGGIRH